MKPFVSLLLAVAGTASLAGAAGAADTTVRVGTVNSVANAPIAMGMIHGYFKEQGITVEPQLLASSADAIALLAQGQLDIIAGGISAGYFNAIQKDLPVTITVDRVSTPIGHNLMIRPDLKDQIKTLKDLKGKVIASNGPGSISTYEVGKMLESVGLTLKDVDVKVIPFPQYAIALQNKAVDAALTIPPFTYNFIDKKLAVPFAAPDDLVEPRPMSIAVNMVNTDWAKAHQDVVRSYYVALMRGVRDYCNAYHGGKIRDQVIDALIKTKNEQRPELLYKYPWPARSVDGRINPKSLLDIQAWYVKNKFTTGQFPIERLVDYSYVDYANKKLGPFEMENKTSKDQGCR